MTHAELKSAAELASLMPWEGRTDEIPFAHKEAFRKLATPEVVIELLADNARLRDDATTMALRLYGESDDTFAPETREVMSRWRPVVEAMLRGES